MPDGGFAQLACFFFRFCEPKTPGVQQQLGIARQHSINWILYIYIYMNDYVT
jgi:hypothetical protein